MTSSASNDATVAEGRRIDLLKLIDPTVDALKGSWTLRDGKLTGAGNVFTRIEIPYEPPEEYDIRVVFKRVSGDRSVSVIGSAAAHQFTWTMGGSQNTTCGFEMIGDLGSSDPKNPTSKHAKSWLVNGQEAVCIVKVRKDGAEAYLDGKLISTWKTDYQSAQFI